MKIYQPNTTQVPNDLMDHWLPLLGEAELKILLIIIRKTFGWHCTRDRISLSQFVEFTGLTKTNAINAIQSLVSKGVILKDLVGKPGFQETYYELVVIKDSNNKKCGTEAIPPGNNKGTPQYRKETTPSIEAGLGVVLLQDPQNIPIKPTIKTTTSEEVSPPISPMANCCPSNPKRQNAKPSQLDKKESLDPDLQEKRYLIIDHDQNALRSLELSQYSLDDIILACKAFDQQKARKEGSVGTGLLVDLVRKRAKPGPELLKNQEELKLKALQEKEDEIIEVRYLVDLLQRKYRPMKNSDCRLFVTSDYFTITIGADEKRYGFNRKDYELLCNFMKTDQKEFISS